MYIMYKIKGLVNFLVWYFFKRVKKYFVRNLVIIIDNM